jgi:peroxiredoxin
LELKNSETILYCNAFETPGKSITLSSKINLKGKSGKTYKLLGVERLEIDKQFLVPDSGSISFKLHMQPLDVNETSFDFIGGEKFNDPKISGIKTFKLKSSTPIQCTIRGEVIERSYSHRLKLIKTFGNSKSEKYITIHNGKFKYQLNCYHIESYSLIFDDEYKTGAWTPIIFFPVSGTVTFKLLPYNRHRENIVIAKSQTTNYANASKPPGIITKSLLPNEEWAQYQRLNDSLFSKDNCNKEDERLREENRFYSEKASKNIEQWATTNDDLLRDSLRIILDALLEKGELLTPEATCLVKQKEELDEQSRGYMMDYIKNHPTIVGFSILLKAANEAFLFHKLHFGDCINIFESIYLKKYPNHPYVEIMKKEIARFNSVIVDKPFIDFTAPDFNGKPVKLSDQIKGNVVLIDLWASWCLPCRTHSKRMIPVFEAYKDKGFSIIGIAREDSFEAGINAARQDKYPWLNLIELKDKGKIWEKYGVGNGGGGSFLVDKKGIIIAIDPTPQEVQRFLDKLLK